MAVTFRQKPGGLSEYLGSYGSRFHNGSARILFTTKTRRREGILCDSSCLRGEILGCSRAAPCLSVASLRIDEKSHVLRNFSSTNKAIISDVDPDSRRQVNWKSGDQREFA